MKPFFGFLLVFLAADNGQSEECHIRNNHFHVIGTVEYLPSYGITYESYKCIRYAEPPTGEGRFMPPRKVELSGTIYANKQTCPVCPQPTPGQLVNEDCLFLNVFVPRNCKKGPLVVVLYIHGGSFISGSGPPFPSYLLGECVIVVTFNYRLGALGFLSLQTPQCSGNAGLKDQQLAMVWVQKHIIHFGGDPNRVTIYGLSAGGCSVSYHYLNSKSCNLFVRGIIESGVALNGWGFQKPDVALRRGRTLAINIGCTGETDEELCDCLKKAPSNLILARTNSVLDLRPLPRRGGIKSTTKIKFRLNPRGGAKGISFDETLDYLLEQWHQIHELFQDILSFNVIPFSPTTESKECPEAFITVDPYTLLKNGLHCVKDFVISFTKDEGCFFNSTVQEFKFALPFLSSLVKYTAPPCIADNPDPYCNEYVSKRLTDYYTEYGYFDDSNVFSLISDAQFKMGTLSFVSIMSSHGVKVYFYTFNFSGKCGTNPLVCHSENFGYIFAAGFVSCSEEKKSLGLAISNKLVLLYANFAKYGNPTPHSQLLTIEFIWLPWNSFLEFYLEVNNGFTLKTCPETEATTFWNDLSSQCCEDALGQNIYPSCPSFSFLN